MTDLKEYVVDEDDLGCLYDYLVAAINGDDISELPRLWNQELGVIRSRPLSEEIRKAREDALDKILVKLGTLNKMKWGDSVRSEIEAYITSLREGAP